jgi:hypothetical protein
MMCAPAVPPDIFLVTTSKCRCCDCSSRFSQFSHHTNKLICLIPIELWRASSSLINVDVACIMWSIIIKIFRTILPLTTIRVIKFWWMLWVVHIASMGQMINSHSILCGKSELESLHERLKLSYVDGIKIFISLFTHLILAYLITPLISYIVCISSNSKIIRE